MTSAAVTGERQIAETAVDEWAWDPATSRLPPTADVVIIGGGIVGCSAALFLARKGISVVLCEKGRIAGEQSGRNWGWVRQQGRAAAELPMMVDSRRIWQGFTETLGEDVGFTAGGCLYLAEDEAELAGHEAWLPIAREFGLDTRLLSPRELAGVLQGPEGRWAGALYTASDGRAEPNRAAPAIARAAVRAGATVITQCAVRGIERTAGRVHRVITEHGAIASPIAVCIAGAWTSLFCRSLGITLPQLKMKGTVARLAPTKQIIEGEAFSSRIAIRRRRDGGYTVAHGFALEHALGPATFRFARKFLPAFRQEGGTIRLRLGREFLEELALPRRWSMDAQSPFERHRVLGPEPSAAILAEIRTDLKDCFPAIADAPFAETWAGMIEASPDVLPIISPVHGLEGYFVATGFSGHGFGIGPGAGRVIADMVTGVRPGMDLKPFRLERFFDGSPIEPGPTI